MNYYEAIHQQREAPCSVEYCDSIRFPFGKYRGERVKEVLEKDPDWVAQFAYRWVPTTVNPSSEYHKDNMALAFSLLFLLGERTANRIGGARYGSC